MPKVISEDDIKLMSRKGRPPIGEDGKRIRPFARDTESNKTEDKQMRMVQNLADAATSAVQESSKALQVNASIMKAVLDKLDNEREIQIDVKMPQGKEWTRIIGRVTKRDGNRDIKEVLFEKVE